MSARWLTSAVFGACAVVPVALLLAVVPEPASLIGFFPDDASYDLQPAWQDVGDCPGMTCAARRCGALRTCEDNGERRDDGNVD